MAQIFSVRVKLSDDDSTLRLQSRILPESCFAIGEQRSNFFNANNITGNNI